MWDNPSDIMMNIDKEGNNVSSGGVKEDAIACEELIDYPEAKSVHKIVLDG